MPLPPPLGPAELVIWRLDPTRYRTGWDSGEGFDQCGHARLKG